MEVLQGCCLSPGLGSLVSGIDLDIFTVTTLCIKIVFSLKSGISLMKSILFQITFVCSSVTSGKDRKEKSVLIKHAYIFFFFRKLHMQKKI